MILINANGKEKREIVEAELGFWCVYYICLFTLSEFFLGYKIFYLRLIFCTCNVAFLF